MNAVVRCPAPGRLALDADVPLWGRRQADCLSEPRCGHDTVSYRTDIAPRDQGRRPTCRFPLMRRLLTLGLAIVAGLTVTACGEATSVAYKGPEVMPAPLITTETPTTAALAVVWTPVQAAQAQAAQLEAAEEQYATCFAYAGLDQGLRQANMRVGQSCSTAGLTSAEVRLIQVLIMEAS